MHWHATCISMRNNKGAVNTVSLHEGTIQFAYDLASDPSPKLDADTFAELAAWRSILYQLGLLGQSQDLYEGYAYGNLSLRTSTSEDFVITASQTSGEAHLHPEHLVHVTHCNLSRFWIEARGTEPPSSESVTHAMIYQADQRMRCVFHVHSQTIWQSRSVLKLPQTGVDVPYGSMAMVEAVDELMQTQQSRPLVFATAGHEDGVFACGHTPRECGNLLVAYLARARAIELKVNGHAGSANE